MRLGDQLKSTRQFGFTYVAMLFALAIFGVALASIGEVWSVASHREKEQELIDIGNAYIRAISTYYLRSPGTLKIYPKKLEDLIDDKRFVGTERHLRKIYRDPFTNTQEWGLVRAADGGIMGIYSLSEQTTWRKQPLIVGDNFLVAGTRYSEWKFIYKSK